MTFANLTTDPGTDRNSFSCIGVTIADAIDDSKQTEQDWVRKAKAELANSRRK